MELMRATEALTATGVLAAVFVATSDEHARLVRMARAAIAEQRELCASNEGHSARRANCWHHRRRQKA